MFRQILDLIERNRRGSGYDSQRGGGGLLGRILGGSSGRGRYADRRSSRDYDADDRREWRGRRRRGDDDDDDD